MTLLPSCFSCIIQAVILLITANGAPVVANKVFGNRWAWPMDNKQKLRDGRRLFGDTKTWRGFWSAILLTFLAAFLLGIEPLTGALFAALAMIGDLAASFLKRRLSYSESSRMRSLDRMPESLLPTLALQESLALNLSDIVLVTIVFFMIEEFVSPVLYKWHIRDRPY